MHTAINTFEQAARGRKVEKLYARLPTLAKTKEARGLAACRLAAFSVEARNEFARYAGVTPPSATTWQMFCRKVACGH